MIYPPSDDEIRDVFGKLGITSCSANVIAVLKQAQRAADVSDVTVLIQGETGTGKQLLAQGIHQLDRKRAGFPFITVHCSTISESLAESELFGHRRGAFSGASGDRKGLFQAAQQGTILLDDVNDLPPVLQPKLLDVIQRGVVRPVGADREIPIDVRVIAACNRPLEPMVREGRFRADLFHRLNVVKLCLPPLRERAADLGGLLLALAQRHSRLYCPICRIDPELVAMLSSTAFAGNVRELENAVQRMLFVKREGTSLTVADWIAQATSEEPSTDTVPSPSCDPGLLPGLLKDAAGAVWRVIEQGGMPFAEAFSELEKLVLESATLGGDTRRVIARRLNTSERTLYYKMRAHGLKALAGGRA
jgi:transcriptional regulator with PAS, ATPase and Fis domain